jgi:FtsZ-binding cell division protein ZapB
MTMLMNNQALNPKNRGGRPPLAAPPQTAAETRALIASEIVKTTPNASKLRHLQKLLESQEHAEERAVTQAAAERANRLLAEANELRRTEYQRRYQLSQQKKATSNDAHVTTQLTAENNTLRETVASLQGELARLQEESQRLADERQTLMRERDTLQAQNDALQATVQTLQPQADALARIKSDVQTELGSMLNADESVRSLQAEFDSLKTGERTMAVLERMKEILLQLKTLQHAYQVAA